MEQDKTGNVIVATSLYLGNITFAGVSGLAFIAYVLKGFYKH